MIFIYGANYVTTGWILLRHAVTFDPVQHEQLAILQTLVVHFTA